MSQVKHTLCLRQNEKQIIIGRHARRRIAERLGWSKKIYKQAIAEICFNFWDKIIDSNTKNIYIVNKGAKWIFKTKGPNKIILLTVISVGHPAHVKIKELIRKFCNTRSGEKKLKEKLMREIVKLDKRAPKSVTSVDSNNHKIRLVL